MTPNAAPAPAGLHLAVVAFDCADPPSLARFWADLLGGTVELDDGGDATVHVSGAPPLDFFRVPDSKAGKNRLHLDLRSRSYEDAVDAAIRLGASRADDVYDGGSWQVLRDPEGNEFCILRGSSAEQAAE